MALDYSVNEKFFDANFSFHRYVIHQGGTGAGKTYSILQHLLTCAYYVKGLTISVVAESMPHLARGCLRDTRKIINGLGWNAYFTESKTEHTFTASNGSFIEFFPADNDSKMRGPKRDILFINECNNISYESFQQLDVRTRKRTILDFNPVRRFWVHDDLLPQLIASPPSEGGLKDEDSSASESPLRGDKGGPYVFCKSTYLDNGYLSLEERANIERRRSNTNWWKVYGEGEIGVAEGLVFSNWATSPTPPKEGLPDEDGFSPSGRLRGALPGTLLGYGIDFGYTHSPTAIVQVNEYNGELYVHEWFYRTGAQNEEIFAFALKHIDLKAPAIADSAEPKTIDYLYRKGWTGLKPCAKGNDSVEFGINLLLERKINVTTTSLNLIKEMREYMWDTNKDGQPINRPIKTNDHAIDAMRYVYTQPKKKPLRFV